MRYQFPTITHLDQVRPAIAGCDEFAINDRGEYMVVNYHVNFADTFPPVETVNDAIRRECRGMKFYPDGKIMARPFSKFFNVHEKPETQLHELDFTLPHTVYTKLDGSMIHPLDINGDIRWATKAGITEVSMQAEVYIANHMKYNEFAKFCFANSLTPIFEWTSPENQIVLKYSKPELTLLAVRHTITGEYYQI
jgi:RNA ligase